MKNSDWSLIIVIVSTYFILLNLLFCKDLIFAMVAAILAGILAIFHVLNLIIIIVGRRR